MATSSRKTTPNPRRPAPRKKSGMSLTFLLLILIILAIVVFILAFREPLARFAAGNAANHGQATTKPSPSPEPSVSPSPQPAITAKPGPLIIDGGKTSPSPEPSHSPAASPTPSPKSSGKPKTSASPSPKPTKTPSPSPAGDKEDLKTVSLYFAKVDDSGKIQIAKVNRSVKFNGSPLLASINALLKGPTANELSEGYVSMIPTGTVLLNVRLEDSIAVLNFNENFQFNSLGVDGAKAQLRQVVQVACQFDTVKAVQILIDGKKEPYLGGDNVEIGKPLTK